MMRGCGAHLPLSGEASEAVAVALVAAVAAVLRGVAQVRGVHAAPVVALELPRPAAEGGAGSGLVRPVAAIILRTFSVTKASHFLR